MNQQTTVETQSHNVLASLSNRYGMPPAEFQETVLATCSPKNQRLTRPEFYTLLIAAEKYSLNPLMKEIYAFPAKGGGVQVIVGVDGWMNLINSHPNFDGMAFEDQREDGKVVAITCRMFRKDRQHPIEVTEYMEECRRATDPWKQWPIRMLRHKAAIQAARYAFGFSNIMEPDEAERAMAPMPQASLVDDLAARRKQTDSTEGFDSRRIEKDLAGFQNEAREPVEDLIDEEDKENTEQQDAAQEASEITSEATEAVGNSSSNLTEGQLELLTTIEEALSGCRAAKDIDAVLSEFGQDVLDAGEVFQTLANKAVHQRRADLDREQQQ